MPCADLPLAYASRTGTKRNLDALRHADWRLVLSPAGVLRHEGFRYALDNGAWHAFQHGTTLDTRAFRAMLRTFGRHADWTVMPDIVAGGRASLELSIKWMRPV